MEFSTGTKSIKNQEYVIVGILCLLVFLSYPLSSIVNAVEVFPKDESPLGISYDTLIDKYWNWWVALNVEEAAPRDGGCLMNGSEKMVMLMETADVVNPPIQKCKISSEQGIMMPLWAAWCDTGGDLGNIKNASGNLDEQLTNCAKEVYNLGDIKSEVQVDGNTVAKLDVKNTLMSGRLDSKVTALNNVTDISTKGFNITYADTHKPNYPEGTWRAGSQGYWIFLKPLPPGEHTVFYNIRITPTGALTSPGTNPHFADITYNLQVQ